MYKVLVKWFDKSELKREIVNPQQLKALVDNLKSGVVYAEVVTPSGVSKDITNLFNK